VVALREDGSLLWSLPFGEVVAGAYPVLARDGTLFIGTSEGTLYAFHD
jgi:outer membrane protein assembly factor BamB